MVGSNMINNTMMVSIISGVVAMLALYIDNRINNSSTDRRGYIKLFLLTMLIVAIVHNMTLKQMTGGMTGGGDLDINIDDPSF